MAPIATVTPQLPSLPTIWLGLAVGEWLRYVAFAGVAWLLAYVVFRRRWRHRKINLKMPTSSDIRREFRWSTVTAVIYGFVATATYGAWRMGWTQLYWEPGEFGWPWFLASIVIAILVHDSWFYWTHRLMHHRALFRRFHKVHHISTNPSPWAAYAFAPPEAVVQALVFPLVACLIPISPLAFSLFMFGQFAFNVAGHTGYEFYPRWLMDSWLGRFISTPTHHSLHHESMRGNYGLYFNVWDSLMGTTHAHYEARFRDVTDRPVMAHGGKSPATAHEEWTAAGRERTGRGEADGLL